MLTGRLVHAHEAAIGRLSALTTRVPAGVLRFVGWFALGLVAFCVEVGVLGILHQWLDVPLWLASALAAEFVLVGRFLTTDRLVFGHRRPTLQRCIRFHLAAVGSFTVSWLVLNGSVRLLDVHFAVATFLGSAAAFTWSALTNFLWVWRPKRRLSGADQHGDRACREVQRVVTVRELNPTADSA